MIAPVIEIKHSITGEFYELYIGGKLMGTYDTVVEAAKDVELITKEEENKNENH